MQKNMLGNEENVKVWKYGNVKMTNHEGVIIIVKEMLFEIF